VGSAIIISGFLLYHPVLAPRDKNCIEQKKKGAISLSVFIKRYIFLSTYHHAASIKNIRNDKKFKWEFPGKGLLCVQMMLPMLEREQNGAERLVPRSKWHL
jgi:hypothetical protein